MMVVISSKVELLRSGFWRMIASGFDNEQLEELMQSPAKRVQA
jgi:hypothetical protein